MAVHLKMFIPKVFEILCQNCGGRAGRHVRSRISESIISSPEKMLVPAAAEAHRTEVDRIDAAEASQLLLVRRMRSAVRPSRSARAPPRQSHVRHAQRPWACSITRAGRTNAA